MDGECAWWFSPGAWGWARNAPTYTHAVDPVADVAVEGGVPRADVGEGGEHEIFEHTARLI